MPLRAVLGAVLGGLGAAIHVLHPRAHLRRPRGVPRGPVAVPVRPSVQRVELLRDRHPDAHRRADVDPGLHSIGE